MDAWPRGSSVSNGAPSIPGRLEGFFSALQPACGALPAVTFISLATRGNCMDIDSNNYNTLLSSLEETISGAVTPPENTTPSDVETTMEASSETPCNVPPIAANVPIDIGTNPGVNVLTLGDAPIADGETTALQIRKSGAYRKRLRKLLQANIDFEVASVMAEKPWSELSSNPLVQQRSLKRDRSEEESPKEHAKKAPRISQLSEGVVIKPTYSEQARSSRVGIRNSEPMNEEQMVLVHDALIAHIAATIEAKGEGPNFLDFSHRPGWILVTCENQESADWLVGALGQIKPWPEATLSPMKESELPKPATATTYFPKCECKSVQLALTLLRAQNKGLNTEVWRVLHSRDDGNGWIVALSLDDPSVEALQSRDCRASLGFRKIHFKIREALGTLMMRPYLRPQRPKWRDPVRIKRPGLRQPGR